MWAGPSSMLWWMVPLIQLVIWLFFVLVMILGMDDGSAGVGERERRAAKTLRAPRRRRRIVT